LHTIDADALKRRTPKMDNWEQIRLRGHVGQNALNYGDDVIAIHARLKHGNRKHLLFSINFPAVIDEENEKTKPRHWSPARITPRSQWPLQRSSKSSVNP
jgi:hypothetical protein